MRPGEHRNEAGYTLVATLALLAVCMLGLAVAGPLWSDATRREREQELLRVGSMYAQAIAAYRQRSPGGLKQYPLRLEDLVLDGRFVGVARHLRTLYADPVNPGQPWGLIRDVDGRIIGVHSRSDVAPLAGVRELKLNTVTLPPAARYSDWKFIAKAET